MRTISKKCPTCSQDTHAEIAYEPGDLFKRRGYEDHYCVLVQLTGDTFCFRRLRNGITITSDEPLSGAEGVVPTSALTRYQHSNFAKYEYVTCVPGVA